MGWGINEIKIHDVKNTQKKKTYKITTAGTKSVTIPK